MVHFVIEAVVDAGGSQLAKVRGEWTLVCLAYNLKRLQKLAQAV